MHTLLESKDHGVRKLPVYQQGMLGVRCATKAMSSACLKSGIPLLMQVMSRVKIHPYGTPTKRVKAVNIQRSLTSILKRMLL